MLGRILALLLIIILLPFLILISILILIFEGRPVFFIQKKYGKDHKVFNFYKFRTMKINSPQLPTEEFKNANLYISKIGMILRFWSIDELPQLYNVLKGDMNFVGPRPCMVQNEETIKKLRESKGIHKIKPGITGLAQVNGRDMNSYEQKVALDYEYLKNSNFLLNLKIIVKTFSVVLFRKNVKH